MRQKDADDAVGALDAIEIRDPPDLPVVRREKLVHEARLAATPTDAIRDDEWA